MQKKHILLSNTVIEKLGRTGYQLTRNVKPTLLECVIYMLLHRETRSFNAGTLWRHRGERLPTYPHQQPLWSHPLPHPTTNRMAVLMHKQASRWLDALDVTKLITMEIYCCTLSITPSLPIHPLTATETEPRSALTSRKLTVRLTLCLIFYNTRSQKSTAHSQIYKKLSVNIAIYLI